MGPIVYIVDDIVAAPGKGRELLALYRARYAPAAAARGMTLDREIVAPPVWLDELSNRLLISWTVPGAGGWWGQAAQSRYDPTVAAFWDEAASLIAERSRYFGAAEGDMGALGDA
jgi:hypothetical protein